MQRTLKFIMALPKEELTTWTKPIVLLKRKNHTEYELPLVIENTQSYPFDCRDEGPVTATDTLIEEILKATRKAFGEAADETFNIRWSSIYQIHKTETTAYYAFVDFFGWEWLESIKGSFTSNGPPIRIEHSYLLDIIHRGAARHGLTEDDLIALRNSCKYLTLRQKSVHRAWGAKGKRKRSLLSQSHD